MKKQSFSLYMLIAAICFAVAAYFLVKNETKKEYGDDDLDGDEEPEPEPAPRTRKAKRSPAPEPEPEHEVKTDNIQDNEPKQ